MNIQCPIYIAEAIFTALIIIILNDRFCCPLVACEVRFRVMANITSAKLANKVCSFVSLLVNSAEGACLQSYPRSWELRLAVISATLTSSPRNLLIYAFRLLEFLDLLKAFTKVFLNARLDKCTNLHLREHRVT